ncbi:MAG: hypothetical protein AB7J13_03010 [Pyrinomonadaceae bacterium]
MEDNDIEKDEEARGLKVKVSGLGQKIIGEIEEFGGVLMGDPLAQAEGEFNVEVGTIRDDLEDAGVEEEAEEAEEA